MPWSAVGEIPAGQESRCGGRCLHLSTEECQGLCLRVRLIMSVVSLLRPVINLRETEKVKTEGERERKERGRVGKVLQEERGWKARGVGGEER